VRVRHLPRMVLAGLSRLSLAWTRATGHRLGPEISPGKVRELYHRDWVCRHNLLDQTTPWRADLQIRGRVRAHPRMVSPQWMVAAWPRCG
jgi:hypothetical protein